MFYGSEVISKMGVWSSLTWNSLELKHSKTYKAGVCLDSFA